MEIKTLNSCINCDNLMAGNMCSVNNVKVSFNQTCESFDARFVVHKNSECGNCVKHEQTNCEHPSTASEGMLCTSYIAV